MPPRSKTDVDETSDTTSAAADEVVYAVGYPHDEFRPFGGDDTDSELTLTADGTVVPPGRVDDIKAAAKAAGVSIRKVN